MPHHLSRREYGKLNHRLCNEEWERLKELARQERRTEEEIESIPRPNRMSRHKLWKFARQTKIGDIPNEPTRKTVSKIVSTKAHTL